MLTTERSGSVFGAMFVSAVIFLALCSLSVGLGGATWVLAVRLGTERKRVPILRWLKGWSLKGLAVPCSIWAIMNLGICWSLQPFMPQVQAAQNRGGSWMPEFLVVTGMGWFVVSSYWTATTLSWVLWNAGRTMDPARFKDFKALCWTCFLGLIIPALLLFLLGGWVTLGLAAALVLAPMAGYAPNLMNPTKLPPMYARAVARMKFGKYSEAEWEIIRELEKCEDDFEGWMMLADLYANQFRDIGEAERTVLEVCDQPRLTPSQLSIALHRLADWYLKLADDPDAARRALQMVADRLPGSHLARMALLRMNQLPATPAEVREQRNPKPIPLPTLGGPWEDSASADDPPGDPEQARRAADEYVRRLRQDPNNVSDREKLGRLLADQLGQPDLGIEQIMLLLNLPDAPEAKRAAWLALVAAWHLKHRHDPLTGRNALRRIIDEFPHSPEAFAARRRLQLLDRQSGSPPG
jgi:hypothetical protein